MQGKRNITPTSALQRRRLRKKKLQVAPMIDAEITNELVEEPPLLSTTPIVNAAVAEPVVEPPPSPTTPPDGPTFPAPENQADFRASRQRESIAQSFHTAAPPRPVRPHKHSAHHNLRLGQWEYQLCKCPKPESHGDAWAFYTGPIFLGKAERQMSWNEMHAMLVEESGRRMSWSEMCARVLGEAGRRLSWSEMCARMLEEVGRDEISRQEYLELLPRVLY
jgi:hypothetical protein